MIVLDSQKPDVRQLLEEEDSVPTASQWVSPNSRSYSETECSDVVEHSSPDVVIHTQEPSRSAVSEKKKLCKAKTSGMCHLNFYAS